MKSDIFERVMFHHPKTFLQESIETTDAYIIQDGVVKSYIIRNNVKIDIGTYGAGDIIAESNLLLDNRLALNYQAATDVTLIKISRHDFQKKIARMDHQLSEIVTRMAEKLTQLEQEKMKGLLRERETDIQAKEIVEHLLRDMNEERRARYEEILLPHFNVMVKALDELKKDERHKKQKENLEKLKNDLDK